MKKKWTLALIGVITVALVGCGILSQEKHSAMETSTVDVKTDRQLDSLDHAISDFKSSIDTMWSAYEKEGGGDQSYKWTHTVMSMQKQAVKVQTIYNRCQKITNMNPQQQSRFRTLSNEMQHQMTRSVESKQ